MQTAEIPRVTGRHRNKALAQERRTRAVELAVGGHSYQDVADIMGYANRGTVYRIIHEALKARQVTSIDEVRELEAARLDALQSAVWPDAMDGDPGAVQAVLRIMGRRAKPLGLIAPFRSVAVSASHLGWQPSNDQHSMYDFTTQSTRPM